MTDKRISILRTLEDLEVKTFDDEKETRIDIAECRIPTNLFNLIAHASFYRTMAGCAEESYPNDLDIKEHVKFNC